MKTFEELKKKFQTSELFHKEFENREGVRIVHIDWRSYHSGRILVKLEDGESKNVFIGEIRDGI